MKELLFSITKRDFRVEYYRGSGKGGQKRNKTDSCCRITHPESGAVAISEDERSQTQNRKIAFKRLTESERFQRWYKIKVAEHLGIVANAEKQVQEWMQEDNLKIEYLT